MGMFLNSKISYEIYRSIVSEQYFVDKTSLLQELFPVLGTEKRYICITRPRRFGKSIMAHMINAFFGKAVSSDSIFSHLEIAQNEQYSSHLNQYQVIYIDFSRIPRDCNTYQSYINRIQDRINTDLANAYPELNLSIQETIWDNLQLIFEFTQDKFIFIMDEWDAIFHKSFIQKKDKQNYLEFLKNLLKGQVYVELAYMTGILPITKYSSGSELNMFLEYDMATKKKFSEYFGFLDSEVDRLFQIYKKETPKSEISRNDLRIWYDGYYTAREEHIYNPHSIICALSDNELSNYWTSSGPYDEIYYYIRNNIEAVQEDIALMLSEEQIPITLQGYSVTEADLNTKNQIYSAMVVYGLLTYHNQAVLIPNKELMDRFRELLLNNHQLGYIHRLAKESERMLEATEPGN